MIEELIDIVDHNGKPTGKTALKSEVHKNGWYHNTIHLWLYTKKGEILLQQRSRKKTIYPLLWDVSVAGHIDAGESFEDAALRETKEEIGLDLDLDAQNLKKIGVELHKSEYNNGNIKDYEFHHIYIAELMANFNQLTPQPNEVEALKLVTFKTFKDLLKYSETNHHFIPSNKPYYQFVLKAIKNQLTL